MLLALLAVGLIASVLAATMLARHAVRLGRRRTAVRSAQ